MTEQLKNDLCTYLGELMHKREQTFDWFEKDVLAERIYAVHVLLDIKDERPQKWYEPIVAQFKLINQTH